MDGKAHLKRLGNLLLLGHNPKQIVKKILAFLLESSYNINVRYKVKGEDRMLKSVSAFFGVLFFIILVGGVIGFSTGYIQNLYDSTVTKQHMNIERKNYEQSASYVQGKIDEVSKAYSEYNQTTDQTAKQAILTTVRNSTASLNINDVTDPALANFILKARGE